MRNYQAKKVYRSKNDFLKRFFPRYYQQKSAHLAVQAGDSGTKLATEVLASVKGQLKK